MNDVLALVIGYLLGSIPSAYIASRWLTGRDIRRLGGGNVGGLNTFREIGPGAGLAVGVVDIGKGAAAVAIAYGLLGVSQPLVLLTGLAAVIGHNWMVWLKFSGGKGMGTAMGSLVVIMPLYGYTAGFFIFLGIILGLWAATRNIALAMGVGLFALPFIVWFSTRAALATILAVVLLLIIGLKFLPTALAALDKSRSLKGFIFSRGQGEGEKKREEN